MDKKGPAIKGTLSLHWWMGASGLRRASPARWIVDTANNTIIAQVERFSLFTVLGEIEWMYLALCSAQEESNSNRVGGGLTLPTPYVAEEAQHA